MNVAGNNVIPRPRPRDTTPSSSGWRFASLDIRAGGGDLVVVGGEVINGAPRDPKGVRSAQRRRALQLSGPSTST
jgi:hypothetical protein